MKIKRLLILGLLLIGQNAIGWASPIRIASDFHLTFQRSRHSLNQIYEFDRNPLGNRIPVLLIPGRAEEFQRNSWWRRFHNISQKNMDFRRAFKLYVFLYNSNEELDVQAKGLVRQLSKHFTSLPPSQPLMLVTYSLGGVITRDALANTALLKRVDTMIAVAVPFHGSPMFDPDWFSEYLNPPTRSPIRRFWDRSLYRFYMFSKSNLTRGLPWDNVDSSEPQFRTLGDQALSTTPPYQPYPNEDEIRRKSIIYIGFLVNNYTPLTDKPLPTALSQKALRSSLNLPLRIIDSLLPFYGFTVHDVFTYMNDQLANLPTFTPDDPQGKNTHLYRFNDGAIPISSMLFLKASTKPYDEDLPTLISLANVRRTRAFINLDHLHLGEYIFSRHRLIKPDMLDPSVGARTPDDWIIYDLLARFHQLKGDLPNP